MSSQGRGSPRRTRATALAIGGALLLCAAAVALLFDHAPNAPLAPRRPDAADRTLHRSGAADPSNIAPTTDGAAATKATADLAPPPDDAVAPAAERTQSERALYAGRVVDAAGQPIAGAAILARVARRGNASEAGDFLVPNLADLDLERSVIARTDASGRFAITALSRAAVALVASHRGYARVERRDLHDALQRFDLEFVLPRARTLAGRVVDRDGAPIDTAFVGWQTVAAAREWIVAEQLADQPLCSIVPAADHSVTYSGSDGGFLLDQLPSGAGTLLIAANGYAAVTLDDTELPDDGKVVLTRDALLLRVVAAESGELLGDARAALRDAATHELVALLPNERPFRADFGVLTAYGHPEQRERDRGRLRWSEPATQLARDLSERLAGSGAGPSPTVLQAVVAAPGRITRTIEITWDSRGAPAETVALERGEEPMSLTGRVVGATSARIELRPLVHGEAALATEPLATLRTEADGTFALRGLPPLRCRLDASADGCAPLSRNLELPLEGLVLEFAHESRIEAVVLDKEGAPAAGVVVELQGGEPLRAWQQRTDGVGRVAFGGLAAGSYRIGAMPRESFERGSGALGAVVPSEPVAFRPEEQLVLASGEARTIELRVPHRAPCRVSVVDERGAALPDAVLSLRWVEHAGWLWRVERSESRAVTGQTDGAGGPFITELVAARYEVIAAHSGIRAQALVEVEPVTGGEVTIVIPVGAPRVRIEGRVVELGSGRPIEGAIVQPLVEEHAGTDGASEEAGGRSIALASALTAADGHFELEVRRLGSVTLLVNGPQPAERNAAPAWQSMFFRLFRAEDEPETVLSPLLLPLMPRKPVLDQAVTIRLLLLDRATGRPLSPATVGITGREGRVEFPLAEVMCDADGRVELTVPRAGALFVEAFAPSATTTPLTHHLPPTPLTVVDDAVDLTLEVDRMPPR